MGLEIESNNSKALILKWLYEVDSADIINASEMDGNLWIPDIFHKV